MNEESLRLMIALAAVVGMYIGASAIKTAFTKRKSDKFKATEIDPKFKPKPRTKHIKPDAAPEIITPEIAPHKKVGGGLYIVILALLINTGMLVYFAYTDYLLLSDEALAKDFIADGVDYEPNPYALFFNIREAVSILLIMGSAYAIYLFSEKSSSFPKWFTVLFLTMLLAVFIDDVIAVIIIANLHWLDLIYYDRDLLIAFIAIILVPYVNTSARSKAMFSDR